MIGAAGAQDLTPVERLLVACVTQGRELDLGTGFGGNAGDDPASWGEKRTLRAQVLRDAVLGRLVSDPDPHGIAVRGARILGRLDLEHVASELPLALRDCLFDEGMTARDARLEAVDLTGSRLEHPTAPALDAAGLVVRASLRLDRVRARAQCTDGAVLLHDAEVGGILSCAEALLENGAGPAFTAAGLHLRRSADLGPGLVATGAGSRGTVHLTGARIDGDLNLAGARLGNVSGPALVADGVRVEASIQLTRGFQATARSTSPAVALHGARASGTLDATDAVLSNKEGCALDASEADLGGDLVLRRVVADGAGGTGAVLLLSTRVGGLVDARGARLHNTSASGLDAENLQVGHDLFLDRGFEATGGGVGAATLDLASARVGGVFALDPARVRHLDDPSWRLGADGFTYRGLPQVGAGLDWLDLVRNGTPWYAAQPYQQLAAACRAAGHDKDARRVLIEQRRDQLERSRSTAPERLWSRITGVTLGYGYQPWRALVLLLLVVAASVALAVGLGGAGGLAAAGSGSTSAPCSLVERIGVGLDTGLPLVSTAAGGVCRPTDTRPGEVLIVAGWVVQLLGWAFATLFVAGFTGAVRRS